MGYRAEILAPGETYHIYNRGVNKADIFVDDNDRQRFLDLLIYYLPQGEPSSFSFAIRNLSKQERQDIIQNRRTNPGKGLVDLLGYCLMGNHIHLLLRENSEKGIATYLQRVFTGYAKYFNTRHERTGPLFSGRFRAVRVIGDEQFLHVTRYIHLNPFVARMVKQVSDYKWSSLAEYVSDDGHYSYCHKELLQGMMPAKEYRKFVNDHADYAREFDRIKHLDLDY
ncbi:MAG: transposase [Candidatus Andersenbacteria bacterium]|nr:transposase [Candidatus Andersenbacteria bacterium]